MGKQDQIQQIKQSAKASGLGKSDVIEQAKLQGYSNDQIEKVLKIIILIK